MKDNINNIRFRASERMFQNSTSVVIEYYDCIQLAYYVFLTIMKGAPNLNTKFDIDLIENLSESELLQWYINREYVNPCCDLWRSSEKPIDILDDFLQDQMDQTHIFFDVSMETKIASISKNLLATELVENLYIYVPKLNKFIEEDINRKYGRKASIITGDFKESLKYVSKDTTYIFSDVRKILDLVEIDRINYSAIMIPYEYRYNFTDQSRSNYIINMKTLEKEYEFKWAVYHIF